MSLDSVLLPSTPSRGRSSPPVTKKISFAVLEDYKNGHDLDDIELDFRLMNELGIDTMRCSFGWDGYEPRRGEYDFHWLGLFAERAARNGIKLRPYIGYTAPWAGTVGNGDENYWNKPPADYQDWYDFVYRLVTALQPHDNILSYEVYNEENHPLWWDGSVEQYKETLRQASLAIRAADPEAEVILGGLYFPDAAWIAAITESGHASYYDINAFHAYPETWSPPDVVVENFLGAEYTERFVRHNDVFGQGRPLWINEMGYATQPGKTEEQQANWFARAFSTFLADPKIEHLGIYEIKDLPEGSPRIGDETNYYLGLTYPDRRKKLAFHTVKLLVHLLDTSTITTADSELLVTVTGGEPRQLYHHLLRRPDGRQVLFVYDKESNPTVQIELGSAGSVAYSYRLDGSCSLYAGYDGSVLRDVRLTPGSVAIFVIDP